MRRWSAAAALSMLLCGCGGTGPSEGPAQAAGTNPGGTTDHGPDGTISLPTPEQLPADTEANEGNPPVDDASSSPEPPRPTIPDDQPFEALLVDVPTQQLHALIGGEIVHSYTVSTSAVGVGSEAGSNRTPAGRHRVREKFGYGAELGTIFRARQDTGRVARILTEQVDVDEDLVLTRILWLEGLEPGVNQGPGIDSYKRYIYIHGTNEEGLLGTPASHGCVRMRNSDVVELFERTPLQTPVMIVDAG